MTDTKGCRPMKYAWLTLFISTALLSAGCGSRLWEDTKDTAKDAYHYAFDTRPTAEPYHGLESISLIDINNDAANTLSTNISVYELSRKSPIYFKPFVNKDDPTDTSIYGLIMMEQLVDRLVQRGRMMVNGEPRTSDYFLPEGVDPDLYRDPIKNSLEELPPRAGLLTGAYVVSKRQIFMTARVTRLDDNAVVSAHTWVVPIDENVRQMLPQIEMPDGLEPSVETSF